MGLPAWIVSGFFIGKKPFCAIETVVWAGLPLWGPYHSLTIAGVDMAPFFQRHIG